MSRIDQGSALQLSNQQQLYRGGADPLLPALLHAINHADTINITVSFIQRSGLNLLKSALNEALEANNQVRILTSDYLHITCPNALRDLMLLKEEGADVRIFETQGKDSFHMKSYIFIKGALDKGRPFEGSAFVGSNNMSKSALTTGLEWCFRHDFYGLKSDSDAFHQFDLAFSTLFEHSQVKELSHCWIDQYIKRRKKPTFVAVGSGFVDEQVEQPKPREDQAIALKKLNETRQQGYQRGLVVLATGMGKTWLAAFDVKQLAAKRVLFVAHREEILQQALNTFTALLDGKVGFYKGDKKEVEADFLFASIQTIGKLTHLQRFRATHFDYIVVDEFHHASSGIYQNLLNYFNPKFLLGLTATPERTDQADILSLCDNNLVYERNLVHGIDSKTLVPFNYFGIWDEEVDYKAIPWRNGKFDETKLENKLVTVRRAKHAYEQWQQHAQTRTLAFCMSIKHAEFMAQYFNEKGVVSLAVYGGSKIRRNDALTQLQQGQVKVLFCVDLFNEGTDLPSIDTVMMLRPSQSKVLFLQQLGRGLRVYEGKSHLVVLDFIGNHHSFLNKPMALLGVSSAKGVVRKLKAPVLPQGCNVTYDLQSAQLWNELAKKLRTSALEDYEALAKLMGHGPTACEFYHYYGSLDKPKQQHGSWFEMIAELQKRNSPSLDKHHRSINSAWLSSYKDFLLEAVELTRMAKCFKMILLKAFIELDGLNKSLTCGQLAQASYTLLQRNPKLWQSDIDPKRRFQSGDDAKWFSFWLDNPLGAYLQLKRKGQKTKPWFKSSSGHGTPSINSLFEANFSVKQRDIELLKSCIQELVDYRLAKYKPKVIQANTDKSNQPLAPASQSNIALFGQAPHATCSENNTENNHNDVDAIMLPYFPNLKIACGHFKNADISDVEYRPAPEGSGKVDPTKHFLAHASGNSMNGGKHPILDGDLLLLERITSGNAGSITNTTIAIERFDETGDEQFLLRDVKKEINEQGEATYLLVARNPEYAVMEARDEFVTFARLKVVLDKLGD